MKLLFKIALFVSLFVGNIIYSQNINTNDVNEVVHGIVYHGNEQYLVTNKGYIKVGNKNTSNNRLK